MIKKFTLMLVAVLLLSSCASVQRTMREPNTKVTLTKSDFTLSDQVTASAKSIKILGIDWTRVFSKNMGEVKSGGGSSITSASIPVIGSFIAERTANYALYELMKGNAGYDVVFYPQYEIKTMKPILGIGFLTKITTVKTTARLGKINN